MILFVSGATTYPRSESVGHLVVPGQWNVKIKHDLHAGTPYAMDNGAFIAFNAGNFLRMLEKFDDCPRPMFTAAPDVVGDAAATLDRWPFWRRLLVGIGHRPAFVAQNGLTANRVPWGEFSTLFIGGDDQYKEGSDARTLCAYAAARGVWVHWGRVNGQRRYRKAVEAGADSIDGTGFSMASHTNIPKVDEWEAHRQATPRMEFAS